jgi:hypothetical protein
VVQKRSSDALVRKRFTKRESIEGAKTKMDFHFGKRGDGRE